MDDEGTARRRKAGGIGIYYGWAVLAAAGGMGFLGFGAIIPGFLVFAGAIRQELGISAAQFAFAVGASWTVGNAAAPAAGWLADRYGGRRLVGIGGILAGIGFAAIAGAGAYWQLLALYSVATAIGRGVGIVPNLMTIVNQWFVRRKALTMTLLNTAFAGGGAAMVPLLALADARFGWRPVILATGALVVILTLLATLVIRSRPEDLGLLPDGGRSPERGQSSERRIAPSYSPSDFTLRQALVTPAFWLLTAAVTLRIAVSDALVINQIPMLVWKGIPEAQAAYYLSLTFLAIIPLRLLMGLLAMAAPARWLLFGGMTAGGIGTAVFLFGTGYPAAAMFVVSIAATEGIATLGWLAVGEYFGRRSFGALVGIMTVCFGAGSLAAPAAAGWIFDRTGDYGVALAIAAPLQVAAGLCYFLARRPSAGATASW